MISVAFIGGADDRIMVYVKGYVFPEGKSFRMARNVGEAQNWRRDIQAGRVSLTRHPTVA